VHANPPTQTRTLRLVAAGLFIVGACVFVAAAVIEFTASWNIGNGLLGVGAVMMAGARLMASKYKLPAP
jgi:hypothetical protein